MRRVAFALVAALALTGCGSVPARQVAEKADTDASYAYAGIATTLNAYEARAGVTPAQVAGAEGLKMKAWQALLVERRAYALTGAVDLTALVALAAQAKALGN